MKNHAPIMDDPDSLATMSTRLHEWGTTLDELVAEVSDAAARGQNTDREPLAVLKATLQAARSRLDDLRAARRERDAADIASTRVGDEPRTDVAAQSAEVRETRLERQHDEALDDALDENVERLEAQMQDWSNQLDHLVADALKGGSQSHDAYRVRIDHLRSHLDAVQAKLTELKRPTGDRVHPWSDFHASIENDWTALEDGFQGLVS